MDCYKAYFTYKSKGVRERYDLELTAEGNLTFAQANKRNKAYKKRIIDNIVCEKASIIKGFQLKKEDKALVIVAHGKFISVYDLETKDWISHTQYSDDVNRLFLIKLEPEEKPSACIILENGEIYLNITAETERLVNSDKAFIKVEGTLDFTVEDSIESRRYFFITTKGENQGLENDDEIDVLS